MAATHFLNRCKFYATSTGTGDFVPESAVQGYLIPSDAGVLDTYVYSYVAETIDGLEWEIGEGTYASGTTSFTRTPTKSSNSNALVNFSTVPVVGISMLAADFISPTFAGAVVFNSTVTFNDPVTVNDTFSFTVPALFADGTAALPSVANIGDTDTGIYWSAADEVSVTTGGTRRLQINSTGHTITGALSVSSTATFGGVVDFAAGAVATPSLAATGDLNTGMWFPAADTIAFSTAGSERLRISDVGLTSITGTFSVSSTAIFSSTVTLHNSVYYSDHIELGILGTGDRDFYLDFHASGTPSANDRSARIHRASGITGAFTISNTSTGGINLDPGSGVVTIASNTAWHAGNDGTGSTLDADLLDGSHASAFVTLAATSTSGFGWVIDEDTMSSNSDTKVPTQQSVKAYVDSKDTVGTQAIWIPAGSMQPTTTNGAAYYSTELATNDVMLNGYAFDTTTAENLCFFVALPKQWDEGTVTFRAYWTATAGSGGVAWSLAGNARSNDDAMDSAYGSAQTVTDTLLLANDMHVTSASSAITIANTPAEADVIFFKVTRAVSNGSDTIANDVILLGIEMYITTNAGTDD